MACLLTELFLNVFWKALGCQNHFPETILKHLRETYIQKLLSYVFSVFFDF